VSDKPKECKWCGNPLDPKRRAFCSDVCQQADYNDRRRVIFDKAGECAFCGKPFEKVISTQRFCCPEHKVRWESEGKRLNASNECAQCGAEFIIDAAHKKYCPECAENIDPLAEKRQGIKRKRVEKELAHALLDESARTQVVEALTEAQERVKPWTPRRFNIKVKQKYPQQEANILFGDWHWGEKVTIEETGGLGEYNTEIAGRYLERCVQAQAEIVGIERAGGIPIKHCNAWLLGDIIPGEKIYKGQHTYIEEQTADQVVGAKNALAETLLNMLDIYESITVRAVVGNHGRMGEKGEGPTWNNFDYLVYLWARDLLKDCPQIEWIIPRSWFLVDDVMGWRFCASHGDDVRMFQRIPWYGLERDVNDMSAMLWDIETSPPTYWLYAHFHQTEQAEQTHGERLMNGSLPGVSMLSVKGMKRRGRPSQTFFGLSEKRGITWRYPLWLEDR
jgi:hypothetical protein